MSEIKIVIPSDGRSDSVFTEIDNQIICVPENQEKEYQKLNPDYEILPHPELKNLAAKRNWILKKFGCVFMIDDDMVSFERVYQKNDQKLNSKEAYDRIQNTYYTATQLNAKLFGFSEDPNPNHYNPYKPFMLKGMTGGGAYGILKDSQLFFSENTTACDSHFITLLNTYTNRYSLIDTRFVCRFKDTFSANGGQSLKRTLNSEKQDTLYLRKMFGESVELRKEKKDAKANHQYQRKIKTKW